MVLMEGSAVVQFLARLPYWPGVFLHRVFMFSLQGTVSLQLLQLPPTVQKMTGSLIGFSKFPFAECVHTCVPLHLTYKTSGRRWVENYKGKMRDFKFFWGKKIAIFKKIIFNSIC